MSRKNDVVTPQHVDALLNAIVKVLRDCVPSDQIEAAMVELGRETDIAYERPSGAQP
jgi:hypothetical protein